MTRENIFVDGNVPENLIHASGTSNVESDTWTELASTVITTGLTGYITDVTVTETSTATGLEYLYRVQKNNSLNLLFIRGKINSEVSLKCPIKVAASSTIDLDVVQWNKETYNYSGFLIGFEV